MDDDHGSWRLEESPLLASWLGCTNAWQASGMSGITVFRVQWLGSYVVHVFEMLAANSDFCICVRIDFVFCGIDLFTYS